MREKRGSRGEEKRRERKKKRERIKMRDLTSRFWRNDVSISRKESGHAG